MDKLKSLAEMISLKGKKALITGCAHGIGEAIALRFAEAGADLELVDIDIDNLNELQPKLAPFNTTVNIHRVDLSKKDEIDALWEKLKDREPDILVNNAGLYPFIDLSADDKKARQPRWHHHQFRNYRSYFTFCQRIGAL
jgi:NADP-dependent 3-hydroxy acid dehydrogenase YdfG